MGNSLDIYNVRTFNDHSRIFLSMLNKGRISVHMNQIICSFWAIYVRQLPLIDVNPDPLSYLPICIIFPIPISIIVIKCSYLWTCSKNISNCLLSPTMWDYTGCIGGGGCWHGQSRENLWNLFQSWTIGHIRIQNWLSFERRSFCLFIPKGMT